jgi:hypothetical protein
VPAETIVKTKPATVQTDVVEELIVTDKPLEDVAIKV